MVDENLINDYYAKAVAGLTEEVLNAEQLWYSHVINLPEKERCTYLVALLHWQVFNGGFHQYFFNSYGQFCYLTIDCVEKIGASECAMILREAITIANTEKKAPSEFRRDVWNRNARAICDFDKQVIESLEQLDDKYCADDFANKVLERLTNYLRGKF